SARVRSREIVNGSSGGSSRFQKPPFHPASCRPRRHPDRTCASSSTETGSDDDQSALFDRHATHAAVRIVKIGHAVVPGVHITPVKSRTSLSHMGATRKLASSLLLR